MLYTRRQQLSSPPNATRRQLRTRRPTGVPVLAIALVLLCATAVTSNASTTRAPRQQPQSTPISLTNLLNASCTAPSNEAVLVVSDCNRVGGNVTDRALTTFIAESMPARGRLVVRGIEFQWPGQTDFPPPGAVQLMPDTILDGTAPIELGGRSGFRWIALLAAGAGADQYAVPYTVTYRDGAKHTTRLWLRDYVAPQSESDVPGVRLQRGTDNANLAAGSGSIKLLMIPVDPSKQLKSLTLPGGDVHTLTYAVSLTNVQPPGGGPTDSPRYTTKGPVEQKYQRTGPWAVAKTTTTTACDSKGNVCDIYAPARLGTDPRTGGQFKHPVLAWANGTGVATVQYDYLLRHLASWGFVVIASRDGDTGNGVTPTDAANFLLKLGATKGNPFYGKIILGRAGVIGHSQGGGAVMGLFARQTPPFTAYVAIHPSPSGFCYASCNYKPGDLANARHGAILYVQSVGDGGAGDTQQYYEQSPESSTKAFGVLAHARHDDSMGNPHCTDPICITGVYGYLGYPTAWFAWQLQGEAALRDAFRANGGEFNAADDDWKFNETNVR